jgi:biopolymer transport protein ExbB
MKRFLLLTLVIFGLSTAAAEAPQSLDELLDQVHSERLMESRHNTAREQRFLAERDQQKRRVSEIQAQKSQAEQQAEILRQEFEQNDSKLRELESQLSERTGDMNELFAIVRQMSADVRGTIENSLVSAQLPGRTALLDQLNSSRQQPTIEKLESLWFLLLDEMNETGKVKSYKTQVIDADGSQSERSVTRVGTFNVISQGYYLKMLADTGRLVELIRQPPPRLRSLAQELEQASEGIHPVAVDPSRGAILGLVVQSPDMLERIQQGGVIGYLILALGAIGLIIVFERYAILGWIGHRLKRHMTKTRPGSDNPLGRLEKISQEGDYPSIETLAAQLDEGVAEEANRLQRGLPTVMILAAVTPLLGLLGTVTGMIETFQSITLFGTGDPRLMSGGISQALVTTQLGLAVAIPLSLLHSFLNGHANRLIETLDQQSTVLLTEFARQASSDHD